MNKGEVRDAVAAAQRAALAAAEAAGPNCTARPS